MAARVEADAARDEIWIFGFGSLIWKAGFEYQKRVEGYIKDYRRVFYQGSTDHRGTPEAPGRVVTLEHAPGSQCWGAVYLIAGTYDEQQKTLAYLEWREKQYDLRVRVDVFGRESSEVPVVKGALVYIASADHVNNLNYAGPAPREAIAQQIASAIGPSGQNDEYLYGLVKALQEMGVNEEELVWLAERVRLLKGSCGKIQTSESTVGLDAAPEIAAGKLCDRNVQVTKESGGVDVSTGTESDHQD